MLLISAITVIFILKLITNGFFTLNSFMPQNILTEVLMPVAIGVIMLGLGLSLTVADFKRVVVYPKAMIIGLVCQMLLLPLICFAIVLISDLPPALAVGFMLLSSSPGGASANLYSHLSKGDVALNVSLTAVNSVLTLISMPLIVNASLAYFMESGQDVPMPFRKVIEVFSVVLVPVVLGMLVRFRFPGFAVKAEKTVKIASAAFLAIIIILAVSQQYELVAKYFKEVGITALVFNLASMSLGYFVPQLFRVGKKQAISIGMEIGIHNGTLAMFIAMNAIGNPMMAIPAAIYSLIMFFTAAGFGYLVNYGRSENS